jgi:hypothetical protein
MEMSISDTTETAVLKLIFQAVAWANYADNAATTPQTNVDVALHTADPGDAGTQSTSETNYTSYARVSVARTTGGWAVAGTTPTTVNPVAAITFPAGTGGSGTITNFSTGKTGGGASAILFSGTVTPNITVGSGVTPQLTTATAITLD